MYNQFHSSNDDDLFGETAKQKDKKQIPNPGFFGDEDFEKLLAESQESPSFTEIRVKSRIINSITSSAAEYINSLESGHRSVFDALNQITNGNFAKRIYADALEDAIVRRMIVLHFLNDLDELKENETLLNVSKKLNLNIDSHFFKIHISSLADMVSFSIEYNVSIYFTLCEQIGRTPIQSIVERSPQIADHGVMNYNHYILKHFEAIRLELGLDS